MPLPIDVINDLRDLGYDEDHRLEFFETVWHEDGENAVRRFLKKLRKSQEHGLRWSVKLRQYAEQCRKETPLPPFSDFSGDDIVKYKILRHIIYDRSSKEVFDQHHLKHVTILSSSLIGLVASQEVIGQPTETLIYLLDEECHHWFENEYQPEENVLWWYSFHWFEISSLEESKKSLSEHAQLPQLREDNSYWVVDHGSQWSSLAGGSRQELWQWDGTKAEKITLLSMTIS